MFNLFKRKKSPPAAAIAAAAVGSASPVSPRVTSPAKPATPATAPAREIRDTLFGDLPLEAWPPGNGPGGEPWQSFVAAREAVAAGRMDDAIAAWQQVSTMPRLESRHYAQAWHFLRAQGVQPPADRAKQLLGVVLEVPMENGLDLLAAYPDYSARYYNYTGAGEIWDRPDPSLDPLIDDVLRAGQQILNAIGPWEEARPAAPPAGQLRINLLSPAGLHFGQGPFNDLAADPLAKPAVEAGTALMTRLTSRRG